MEVFCLLIDYINQLDCIDLAPLITHLIIYAPPLYTSSVPNPKQIVTVGYAAVSQLLTDLPGIMVNNSSGMLFELESYTLDVSPRTSGEQPPSSLTSFNDLHLPG